MGDRLSLEERRLIDDAIEAGAVRQIRAARRGAERPAQVASFALVGLAGSLSVAAGGAGALAAAEPLKPGRGVPTEISIEALLHWAFAREKAQLEWGVGDVVQCGYGFVSSTAAILRHEELGCRITGGGVSEPHSDAVAVSAAVASLPRSLGGRSMALSIVEHARAGVRPDAMCGVEQRIEPLAWTCRGAGGRRKGKVAQLPRGEYVERGRWRAHDRPWVPVRLVPSSHEIAAKRRHYLAWRLALVDLWSRLRVAGVLGGWMLTEALPPRVPWRAAVVDSTE